MATYFDRLSKEEQEALLQQFTKEREEREELRLLMELMLEDIY